jgi:hypothetical protein
MSKFSKKEVDAIFKKVDKGIWEMNKWKAKDITKKILIAIWSVTIFPILLIWMFIMDERR